MVLVFKRVSGSTYRSLLFGSSKFKCVSPCHPRRRPNTSQLFSVARYVTSLITELRPGTSPPPVSMPIRLVDFDVFRKIEDRSLRSRLGSGFRGRGQILFFSHRKASYVKHPPPTLPPPPHP